MSLTPQSPIVQEYLNLLDAQRESALSALEGISHGQLWQRPAPKEWCIGEILNHNVRLFKSVFPLVNFAWRWTRWTGNLLKNRGYRTYFDDPYRKETFPMWAGFLWTPKYTPDNPVTLDKLASDLRGTHAQVRAFYRDKDEFMLGNVFVFDPLFGFLNLIVTLQIGIYHDQLHFDDVIAMAGRLKNQG